MAIVFTEFRILNFSEIRAGNLLIQVLDSSSIVLLASSTTTIVVL